MALVSISICWWHAATFFVARVCVTAVGLVQSNFLCPQGRQFIFAIYACAFTGVRSFTVLSVRGILLSFGVFWCFLLTPYYYLYLYYYFISIIVILLLLLLLLLLFPLSCWLWVWWVGLVAGLQAGQAFGGVLATWVWGPQL